LALVGFPRSAPATLWRAHDGGHGVRDGNKFVDACSTQPSSEANHGHRFDLEGIGSRVLVQAVCRARRDRHKPGISGVMRPPVSEWDNDPEWEARDLIETEDDGRTNLPNLRTDRR